MAGPDSLGGRCGPERIEGHACPACARAIASVGSVGPTAMEMALAEHLRATGREEEAERLTLGPLDGLVGFAAIAYAEHRRGHPAPAANALPWEHIRHA